MAWDHDEEKRKLKIRKATKNAAYSVGGGVALRLLEEFYPYPEGAGNVAELFGNVGALVIFYGCVVLFLILIRRYNWALYANALMLGLVVPAGLFFFLISSL